MEKHASGKSLNLEDRVSAGWSPAPLPPVAPDGGLVLELPRSLPVVQPSICLQGPCRRYHRMVTDVGEQEPVAGAPNEPVKQVIHTCFIAPGFEIDLFLGDSTVYECNRWDPQLASDSDVRELDRRRSQFYVQAAADRGDPTPEKETSE